MPRELRSLKAHLTVHYWDPTATLPVNLNHPPASPRFSLSRLTEHLSEFIRDFLPDSSTHFPSVICDHTMSDYAVLKVNDLKKLLSERNLAVTGNKPDLIKRLQDADRETEGGGAAAPPAPGMLILHAQLTTSQRSFVHAPVPSLGSVHQNYKAY